MHPSGTPIWSFMFITVACGAISGFHSTQSPLMARCMKSEKQGHFVFYGAMVSEGVIALVWAAAGCALYEVTGGLNTGLAAILANGQSAAIYDVCVKTMGKVGVALAMLGVIACPITSGDTAFRSARLTLADWFKVDQKKWTNRLKLCIPVLGVGAILGIGNALGKIDYTVIWRYFSWTNQTLAMIVLWAASMYLFYEKKNYWITAVPATFMSAVSATYFLLGNECFGRFLNHTDAAGKVVLQHRRRVSHRHRRCDRVPRHLPVHHQKAPYAAPLRDAEQVTTIRQATGEPISRRFFRWEEPLCFLHLHALETPRSAARSWPRTGSPASASALAAWAKRPSISTVFSSTGTTMWRSRPCGAFSSVSP